MTIPAFALPRYLRIVRASGWYDLVVTWPFALPWTFVWLHAQLGAVALALGLPGTLPPLDAMHVAVLRSKATAHAPAVQAMHEQMVQTLSR